MPSSPPRRRDAADAREHVEDGIAFNVRPSIGRVAGTPDCGRSWKWEERGLDSAGSTGMAGAGNG